MRANRSAYVKSPWLFELRDVPVGNPGVGQLLVQIKACGICGTDLHTADRTALDWQAFGHEMAGLVVEVGEGVSRFVPGDRVALNTAAPCGKCPVCLPQPYGKGKPELCRTPASYWGGPQMGFGEYIISPHESAVLIPDAMPFDVASMVEPMGVSIDLVETAEVGCGDNVLIIGAGPLGLGAITVAKNAGAGHIAVAVKSTYTARCEAALALGADEIIEIDITPLTDYDFGQYQPDKILVTSPPQSILDAIAIAPFGATIAYIGIAWGPGSVISFDADDFHFKRLSLKASFASPDTQSAKSLRTLQAYPELGRELISHRFKLDELEAMMHLAHTDRGRTVKKMVMVNE